MYEDRSNEEINGRELINLINERISNENLYLKLHEYEIFPILDEPRKFFNLAEERYLLINKLMCKEFYFFWKNKYLESNFNCSSITKEEIDINTKCILLINPNFASAWSRRKEITTSDLKSELEFNRLVLTKHFKCEQAYIHRRWLIRKILYSSAIFPTVLASQEINLVIEFLSPKAKSNYYCWSYLTWFLDIIFKNGANFLIISNLIDQNERLETLLYKNPSDNCVFHFRLEYLFKYFLKINPLNFEKILNEISLIIDLILRFPQFSTTWNYGKYFLHYIKPFLIDFKHTEQLVDNLKNIINEKIQIIYPKNSLEIDLTYNHSLKDLIIRFSILCYLLNENNNQNSIQKYSKNFSQFIKIFC